MPESATQKNDVEFAEARQRVKFRDVRIYSSKANAKFHSAKSINCAEFYSIKSGGRRFGVKFCGATKLNF